ncbi:MAG: MerR family transcriptional regulator [Burkholderiales bacterium]|nr:MerR family transcriptional regulator [Burkholderiales bacterium]
MDSALPPIPAKRYFTIGEVSELCLVKPYVLRYWEQEFIQLKPMKRRGNRRYYQHHEVLLIRRIRELLYDQGFTISGARNRLTELGAHGHLPKLDPQLLAEDVPDSVEDESAVVVSAASLHAGTRALTSTPPEFGWMGVDLSGLDRASPKAVEHLRDALLSIRDLLA